MQKFRGRSLCIHNNSACFHLRFDVVGAVGLNGVMIFVFIWHGLAKGSSRALRNAGRNVCEQPTDVALGLVGLVLAIAKLILFAEPPSQLGEPLVILATLTNPDCARMVDMGLLVGTVQEIERISTNVMCSIQKLGSFQYHLDDMFVAMISRSDARKKVKSKDVHYRQLSWALSTQIHFQQRYKADRTVNARM